MNLTEKSRILYATTGLSRNDVNELCQRILEVITGGSGREPWPPVLGLYGSVVVTLTALRRNRRQVELAEEHGVSQSTISRAIAAVTPLIAVALNPEVPVAEELGDDVTYLVDGTLVPCWSWSGRKDLYSGKHRTTGMNLQVASDIYGNLAWISDPLPGSVHDVNALDKSGVLDTLKPRLWIGDRGYQGRGMTTPTKRKPGQRELPELDRTNNKVINGLRATIERVIAHLKNWHILATDYRRPIHTFETTISAVIGLHFWKTA